MREIFLWNHDIRKMKYTLGFDPYKLYEMKKNKPKGVEFVEYDVKEISKKDLNTMRKYADGLRKKGFAISPRPKEKTE